MKNEKKIGEFSWNELATSNIEAAKKFYGSLFGWEFSERTTDDEVYTLITVHNKNIGGMWAIPKDQTKQIQPHWLSYVSVQNIEASIAKAVEQGGKLIKSEEVCGECRYAIIADPMGAHIALCQSV